MTNKVKFFPANDTALEEKVNKWLAEKEESNYNNKLKDMDSYFKIHKMYLSPGQGLEAKFWIWYEVSE